MNKIKMSTHKISLINNIGTPPNSTIKYTPANSESGANIHLSNKSTPTMPIVIMSKELILWLIDGSTMESSHVVTLQIPGITPKAIKIHISPKTRIAALIFLGVLFDDVCTITLELFQPQMGQFT